MALYRPRVLPWPQGPSRMPKAVPETGLHGSLQGLLPRL